MDVPQLIKSNKLHETKMDLRRHRKKLKEDALNVRSYQMTVMGNPVNPYVPVFREEY